MFIFFSKTPSCNHQSCNKCGLYANVEAADIEAIKKAAKDAAKLVSAGKKGVHVEVEEETNRIITTRNRP